MFIDKDKMNDILHYTIKMSMCQHSITWHDIA